MGRRRGLECVEVPVGLWCLGLVLQLAHIGSLAGLMMVTLDSGWFLVVCVLRSNSPYLGSDEDGFDCGVKN